MRLFLTFFLVENECLFGSWPTASRVTIFLRQSFKAERKVERALTLTKRDSEPLCAKGVFRDQFLWGTCYEEMDEARQFALMESRRTIRMIQTVTFEL